MAEFSNVVSIVFRCSLVHHSFKNSITKDLKQNERRCRWWGSTWADSGTRFPLENTNSQSALCKIGVGQSASKKCDTECEKSSKLADLQINVNWSFLDYYFRVIYHILLLPTRLLFKLIIGASLGVVGAR